MHASVAVGYLALVGSAIAAPKAEPQLSFGSASGVVAGQCTGQSCTAASVAGITGKLPDRIPEGGTDAGWQCVAKYNPAAKQEIDRLKTQGGGSSGRSGLLGGLFGRLRARQLFGGLFGGGGANDPPQTYRGRCAENILIYAKGTTETGELGLTVGPILSTQLTAKGLGRWVVQGVSYTADSPGNFCVGLPGGQVAKSLLESINQKCPNANLWTSGYSQGAMVAHNAVFYASDAVRAKVKGILAWGNPFNGAKLSNWNGPIKTFCKETDAVCTGQFKIGGAHLTYAMTDVGAGVDWLLQTARSG